MSVVLISIRQLDLRQEGNDVLLHADDLSAGCLCKIVRIAFLLFVGTHDRAGGVHYRTEPVFVKALGYALCSAALCAVAGYKEECDDCKQKPSKSA